MSLFKKKIATTLSSTGSEGSPHAVLEAFTFKKRTNIKIENENCIFIDNAIPIGFFAKRDLVIRKRFIHK